MEYVIINGLLIGGEDINPFELLATRVTDIINHGGNTVGGLSISDTGYPYQAVMKPLNYTINNNNNNNNNNSNSNTNINNPSSGGARKTRIRKLRKQKSRKNKH